MAQQVPLKNGIDGPVIGTATVKDDGTIIAEITDENFSGLITADLSSISLPHQRPYICPGCQTDRCERVEKDVPHCVCCRDGHVV